MKNLKQLSSIETGEYSLDVFECLGCGFHIGLDATFLDQVEDIKMRCPSCQTEIDTEGSD